MKSLKSIQISDLITVVNADSLDICSQWSSEAALITDPPYGMSYKSSHNSGRGECDMIRKDGNFSPILGDDKEFDPSPWLRFNRICLFGAQNFSSKLPDMRGWIVWDKLAGKTPCSQSDCELAWTNRNSPVRMFTHLWRGIMRAGEENVVNGGKLHPNQKPVALMSFVLETMGISRGDTVYDPYMGSGSIGVACHRAGVNYVGVEIDSHYFDVAKQRLERECKQPTLAFC